MSLYAFCSVVEWSRQSAVYLGDGCRLLCPKHIERVRPRSIGPIYYHLPNFVLVSLTSIFTINNKTASEFLVVHYLCSYLFDNTCIMIIMRIIKMSKKVFPLASFYC